MLDQVPESGFWERVEQTAARLKPTRLSPELVPWGDGPDPDRFWVPECLVPLWGTPAYGDLTDEQRLRYNQYFALELAERFIWLEERFIIAGYAALLRGPVPSPALRILFESFIADEQGHTASFRRLLKLARPDMYDDGIESHFCVPPRRLYLLTALAARLPRLLSGWVLLSGAIEETTLLISRSYKETGDDADPLFARVHTLHAQDEARHCVIDTLVAEWLIGGQRGWAKRANATVFDLMFQAYYDPGWGYDRPIRRLVADFPDLRDREAETIGQAMRACSEKVIESWFSPAMSPITSQNAKRFDMLGRAIRNLSNTIGH